MIGQNPCAARMMAQTAFGLNALSGERYGA